MDRRPYGRRKSSAVLAAAATLLAFASLASCGDAETGPDAGSSDASPPVEIVVSAASDLSPVLEELGPLFEEESDVVLKVNLGSTGQLSDQIAAGADVDIFLAASASAIADLAGKGLLVPASDQMYARGLLVMWTREDSGLAIASIQDLAGTGVAHIAIANPDHAPYGQAAKQALESAGLWEQFQPKLVPAENVRQAFQFAESGNAEVGLVSLSLVIGGEGVYTPVPEDLYQPIEQTLGIMAASKHQEEAQQFVAFLTGETGGAILSKYGFVVPEG